MGVIRLWDILEPVGRPCEINSQETKCLAVDLSCWICDSCTVTALKAASVVNPHLRNLYYRASCLKLSGVNLVFVTEGQAPKLKTQTILKRCGSKRTENISSVNRGHLNIKLKECAKMLNILGLTCVRAAGEAEAMCAYLNAQKVVDGCVTNDSDAFLYGAETVYRNFSMERKVAKAVCYTMSDIKSKLGLDREMLVALSLLLGCDYTSGVPGIGQKKALTFLKNFSNGHQVLRSFREWKEDTPKNDLLKNCCPDVELVKNQAVKLDGFPSQEVIREFLVPKDKIPATTILWKQPNQTLLKDFCKAKLDWPVDETEKSSFQLCARWQLEEIIEGCKTNFEFAASKVVKQRKVAGKPFLEVEWVRKDDLKVFTTIEPDEIIKSALPEIYSSIVRKTARPVTKKKSKDEDLTIRKIASIRGVSPKSEDQIILHKDTDFKNEVIVLDDSSSDEEFNAMLRDLKRYTLEDKGHNPDPGLSPKKLEIGQPSDSLRDTPLSLTERVKILLRGDPDLESTLKSVSGSQF